MERTQRIGRLADEALQRASKDFRRITGHPPEFNDEGDEARHPRLWRRLLSLHADSVVLHMLTDQD